jgi:hypothetical protein
MRKRMSQKNFHMLWNLCADASQKKKINKLYKNDMMWEENFFPILCAFSSYNVEFHLLPVSTACLLSSFKTVKIWI